MNQITHQQALDIMNALKSRIAHINVLEVINSAINTITYMESLELIDLAAQENRLYHHNGGQAYLRMSLDLNVLMVIDHTRANRADVSLYDGTEYFKECTGYNYEHSKRLREHSTTMVEWYTEVLNRVNKIELDLV